MAKKSSKIIRESTALTPGMMRSHSKQEARWRAESDLDTLTRAEEICSDKKRHTAARGVAEERIASMQKITKSRK